MKNVTSGLSSDNARHLLHRALVSKSCQRALPPGQWCSLRRQRNGRRANGMRLGDEDIRRLLSGAR